ncbi:hypothetical protein [Pseudarthrobacter enclensis]|uniref:DUF1971 domain-containing protein n=1 Tax=Pseudarthrobacter enclensis TaxID=993070 RepID=A0ABT9S0T9_9MICC|nr:hypothetical protein [Pseudarthrobacter enclensis]MDP9890666.1 hypothetical protein [Pseudarthrobacter enclensis]
MFKSEAMLNADRVPGHPLSTVPAGCWHRITLTYPDGEVVVLAFAERGPGSEENYRETILRTQMCAPSNVRCIVTREDGTTSEAETWGAPL